MKYLLRALVLTLAINFVILFVIHSFDSFSSYWDISMVSILVFLAMSFGLYFIAKKAFKSKNKQIFISIALGNLFFKFLITGIILAAYYKIVLPEDTKFVLPYLFIYISFTIFETVLLLKVSDGKI